MIIEEDYVSFETAKLLKEKGFKNSNSMLLGKSGRHYNKYETFPSKDMAIDASIDCEDKCPLVTLQMAMKWMREVYGLFIRVTEDITGNVFEWSVYQKNYGCKASTYVEDSYEQACEAAIKYCIENLI